ncbi:MAG: alpha-L-fucosidase [Rikenellaceae bacterium]
MMKKTIKTLILLALSLSAVVATAQSFEPNWESLRRHSNPEWALDVKFGVYAHWGPYTEVGAWEDNPNINWANYYITAYQGIYSTNPKEARKMTFERRFGKITEGAGYYNLCEQFDASGFNAKRLVDLIERSGAKYAGICAVHHDGFAMWNSGVVDFCAGKMGPKRDLLGEVMTELKKREIKTIATFHHDRTHKQFQTLQKNLIEKGITGVDINDPERSKPYWFLGTLEHFSSVRTKMTIEVIDKYQPDILWFDGGGGEFGTENILSHFFNEAEQSGREVCIHNKGNFGTNFGIYSYENGAHRPGFVDWPWEDDTPSAEGWCDWPWWYGIKYKKSADVIVRLVDLVARNGGLLLSMNPRPDGSLDVGQVELLEGIGRWLKVNGESIYGTRPWVVYAEGNVDPVFYTELHPDGKRKARPIQPDVSKFDQRDIRFVAKGNTLYATQLALPSGSQTVIKSLGTKQQLSTQNKIKSIELLGYGKVKFRRTADELIIELPKRLPNSVALAFKIEIEGELVQRVLEGKNKVIPMMT